MRAFKTVRGKRMRHLVLALVIVYLVGIQLPLLSPFRPVNGDEFLIADSAYTLTSGQSLVPAGQAWSHIIPEAGTINFHYTPAHFYLLAWTFQVLGLSPESTGVLHLILRLLASGVFFLAARRAGCSTLVSGVLATIWATFACGPVGRPEDLGLLFLITCAAMLLVQKQPGYAFALAGICLGLAFLTHPMTLMIGLPLAFAILFANRRDGNLKSKGLTLLGAMIPTSALWLFWIVPYWSEFRAIFFGYVLPVGKSPSYLNSVVDFGKKLVYGTWTKPNYWQYRSPILLHYSLVPVVVLLIYLVFRSVKKRITFFESWLILSPLVVFLAAFGKKLLHDNWKLPSPLHYSLILVVVVLLVYLVLLSVKERTTLFESWLILSPLVIFPLLAARSVMHGYYMAWFSMGAITLIPIVARSSFSKPSYLNLMERVFIVVLVSTIALQLSAHFLLQGLWVAGDLAMRTTCGSAPHVAALAAIPATEKTLTNSGYVFYHMRDRNPIFWPAGLQGETPTGVPFKANYDSSFRWAVLSYDLANGRKHGGQFPWDTATYEWFWRNYSLHTVSTLDKCYNDSSLAKFSQLRHRTLCLYKTTSGG